MNLKFKWGPNNTQEIYELFIKSFQYISDVFYSWPRKVIDMYKMENPVTVIPYNHH